MQISKPTIELLNKIIVFHSFKLQCSVTVGFFKNIFVKTDRGVTGFSQISKMEHFVTILSA